MRKIVKIGIVSALMVMVMGTAAFAGTTFKVYSVAVGKFNGCGYSSEQKKSSTGVQGRIRSIAVGGDYVVDVRMQNDSAHAEWVRDLKDSDKRNLPVVDALAAGEKVLLKFSNDWNTPVDVIVSGDWKSN